MAYYHMGYYWLHTCDGNDEAILTRLSVARQVPEIWCVNVTWYFRGVKILHCPYCGERLEVPEELAKTHEGGD